MERLPEVLPSSFVVLDFETNGLDADSAQIISIGAARFYAVECVTPGGSKVATYSTLVQPLKGARIGAKITEITGLTRQELVDKGRPLEVVIPELLQFIGADTVVAYNAQFEERFLAAACKRLGLVVPSLRYDCALQAARDAWPELDNHRLVTVAESLGLDTSKAHRALEDVLMTVQVYVSARRVTG